MSIPSTISSCRTRSRQVSLRHVAVAPSGVGLVAGCTVHEVDVAGRGADELPVGPCRLEPRDGVDRLGRHECGRIVSVPSQAMTTPFATKIPNTRTGGIGVRASARKATTVVIVGEGDRAGELVVDDPERGRTIARAPVAIGELADHVDRIEDRDRQQGDRDHRAHDVGGVAGPR